MFSKSTFRKTTRDRRISHESAMNGSVGTFRWSTCSNDSDSVGMSSPSTAKRSICSGFFGSNKKRKTSGLESLPPPEFDLYRGDVVGASKAEQTNISISPRMFAPNHRLSMGTEETKIPAFPQMFAPRRPVSMGVEETKISAFPQMFGQGRRGAMGIEGINREIYVDMPKDTIERPTFVTPKCNDVLFGQSKNLRDHPGNKWRNQLIAKCFHRYNDPSASKQCKKEISGNVVDAIKKIGGRFLKQRKREKVTSITDTQWEEIDNEEEVRTRVTSLFRDFRAKCKDKSKR